MTSPSPRFTGIFVPVEILELENLSLLEMFLLSIIDVLYSSEHGGCHASNEYLAKRLKVQENTIAKSLTHLRSLELIEDVSFDGRKRVIRSLINRYVDKAQSKAGLDKNPSRVGQKSNPGLDENPSGVPPLLIYDSKEDKEEDIARTAAQPHKKGAEISFSFDQGKFQNICPEDLEAWKELYNSTDVERELKEMVQWIIANKSKSKHKTLWRKFILGWLQRANEKSINRSAYQSSKEKQVLSRHTGFKKDEREVHPSRTIDLSED